MAHVPLLDHPKGFVARLARRYTLRRFGKMAQPTAAAAHHGGVLVASGGLEAAVQLGWKKLDHQLRWLAVQGAAARIGCPWCVDFGTSEAVRQGVDPAKLAAVATWRASELFDEREQAVLAYTEAATDTPAVVSDELAARVRSHLGDAEFVELAAWVALENYRSRFNAGLGLTSQGFSAACGVGMLPGAPQEARRATEARA